MDAASRDPERALLDRPPLIGIALGGVSLAGAVVLIYGVAWWRLGEVLEPARSAAFATWMVGHLVLAARMRTENGSLLRVRRRANRPYLAWTAGLLVVLVMTVLVSRFRSASTERIAWMALAVSEPRSVSPPEVAGAPVASRRIRDAQERANSSEHAL